jgi:hypothetical protein
MRLKTEELLSDFSLRIYLKFLCQASCRPPASCGPGTIKMEDDLLLLTRIKARNIFFHNQSKNIVDKEPTMNFCCWRNTIQVIQTLGTDSCGVHELFGVLLLSFFGPTWRRRFSCFLVADNRNSIHVVQGESCLGQGKNIFPLVAPNQL